MRIFTILTLGFLFILGGQSVNAQTNSVIQGEIQQKTGLNQFREGAAEARQGFVDERKDLTVDYKTTRLEQIEANNELQRALIERLQNADTNEEREAILAEANAAREAIRDSATDARESFQERAKSILANRLEYIFKKFDAFINRAKEIVSRIDTKLAEIAETDINVDEEKIMLEESLVLLNSAASNVAEARAIYDAIDTEIMDRTEIKSDLEKIKELLKSARADIKDAYQKLRDIIKSLREKIRPTNPADDGDEDVESDDDSDDLTG